MLNSILDVFKGGFIVMLSMLYLVLTLSFAVLIVSFVADPFQTVESLKEFFLDVKASWKKFLKRD